MCFLLSAVNWYSILILPYRVIDKSMKNFKAFFRWLYVGKGETLQFNSHRVNTVVFFFKICVWNFHASSSYVEDVWWACASGAQQGELYNKLTRTVFQVCVCVCLLLLLDLFERLNMCFPRSDDSERHFFCCRLPVWALQRGMTRIKKTAIKAHLACWTCLWLPKCSSSSLIEWRTLWSQGKVL